MTIKMSPISHLQNVICNRITCAIIIRASTWENVPSHMYAQWRLKSRSASVQSDQNVCCLHEETLHTWLSKMHPMKILIRLCKCTVWSESSLGAHVQRYVCWQYNVIPFFKCFLCHLSCCLADMFRNTVLLPLWYLCDIMTSIKPIGTTKSTQPSCGATTWCKKPNWF